MLAHSRHHTHLRRGIVLVLVLAMLGLLALIGVTFATFSGQARINARNFLQGVNRPQDDELMDFALMQLITDTSDPRSVIRGHSLARDMYGNDAGINGYLAFNPATSGPLLIQKIQPVANFPYYDILTNIPTPAGSLALYGYNFARWIMRLSYIGPIAAGYGRTVSQSLEILIDDTGQGLTAYSGQGFHVFRVSPIDMPQTPNTQTVLDNPTLGTTTQLAMVQFLSGGTPAYTTPTNYPFTLDGRWLRAFNGPGMGSFYKPVGLNGPGITIPVPLSTYGNFRYNGLNPNVVGMDEDYDACDLENWFLAIQSADGQVIIPSFHRPGIIRYDPTNRGDWDGNFRANNWVDSASRILRPVAADGHDPATFPDLVPEFNPGNPNYGKITYDVDNDGDGINDSVWLDLGYPARRDSRGQLYKPLFAFMVIGLNGRIPLNTAGNLAGQTGGITDPTTGVTTPALPLYSQAQHLGNSVSEVDPTYALQNAYLSDYDPYNTLPNPPTASYWTWPPNAANSQVDNAYLQPNAAGGYTNTQSNTTSTPPVYNPGGVDVRLTQLRNLLAGTRPAGSGSGDNNNVFGAFRGGTSYVMPNGMADVTAAWTSNTPHDIPSGFTDAAGNPRVQNPTTPVPGRWGEAQSVPGVPVPNTANPTGPPFNLLQWYAYTNPVRAGYSFDITDLLNNLAYTGVPIFSRDAADDNYNAFDVWPPINPFNGNLKVGEFNDLDYYDTAGALLLPVERMRRFVTPADINGTGRVSQWPSLAYRNPDSTGLETVGRRGTGNLGADNFGRVVFSSYFRPAGAAGAINTTTTSSSPATAAPNGAIAFGTWLNGTSTPWPAGTVYEPDVTSNPLHGYESFKIPNLFQFLATTFKGGTGANPTVTPVTVNGVKYSPQAMGGMPVGGATASVNALPSNATKMTGANTVQTTAGNIPNVPYLFNTYDNTVNSKDSTDGMNEADELNLYVINPLLDSPFGPSDLEWLYRSQDVDGASLTSRLAQLAPVSFTNTIDGLRRRRLFALDSFETNNFVWTNDNPVTYQLNAAGGYNNVPVFPNNSRFVPIANAGFENLNAAVSFLNPITGPNPPTNPNMVNVPNPTLTSPSPTWSLAHRGKKINLNYPLPVSNDSDEPVRQKWVSDTYQLLKAVLPPDAVDTAEELAQLSQFVINIIDFRDPDGTMTHWANPDVVFTPPTSSTAYPTLTLSIGTGGFDQYGMEYNPVAINEVLAYTFSGPGGNPKQSNGFFIELVNTLTAAYNPNYDYSATPASAHNWYYGNGATQASSLNLGGFTYVPNDPYSGACWDLVFTDDNPMVRPDPYRGELFYNPKATFATTVNSTTPGSGVYALIPMNRESFPGGSSDTTTTVPTHDVNLIPLSPNAAYPMNVPGISGNLAPFPTTTTTPPTNYFYVLGTLPGNEAVPLAPFSSTPPKGQTTPSQGYTQLLSAAYNPVQTGKAAAQPWASANWHPGILPQPTGSTTTPPNYTWNLPLLPSSGSKGLAQYFWVCLRRPANPFAPVSAANPMCVVDSMRFPYIDGSGAQGTPNYNVIFSAQRLQPYRGGHAVPLPGASAGTTSTTQGLPGLMTTATPPDPRYGYSEQLAVPQFQSANYGGTSPGSRATNNYYHTLGLPNDSAENWDYLVFNDRDFTSVAELMLVPGCPPGLFTKQFVEFAPSQINAANIFASVTPVVPSGPTWASKTVPPNPVTLSPSTFNPFATTTVPFLTVTSVTPNPNPRSGNPSAATAPVGSPTTLSFGTTSKQSVFSNYTTPYIQPNTPGVTTEPTLTNPVQPHTYPYLVDKFFYTGASNFYYPPTGGSTDPSAPPTNTSVVGGPASDGWFKMFEFFEVPSQMINAIGPVASGTNFDWARQDTKPGLLNINLIIDEEVFFSVFGQQNSSLGQTLLNSIELPLLANASGRLPYKLPLTANAGNPPIPFGGPPVPLVVSSIQPTGAPNFVYPITAQSLVYPQGYLSTDPIFQAVNTANGAPSIPPPIGNRLKAAFAQFLWLRHGGSGYLFGMGSGATGQNSAVATPNLAAYNGATPAERYFHSLSYPDINHTIMRPAALPPSPFTNPPVTSNAASLYTAPTTTPSGWYFNSPSYYSPYISPNTNFATGVPIVYSGDPGVRNPILSQGYLPSSSTVTTLYSTTGTNGVPAGVPIPVNMAFPAAAGTSIATAGGIVMPPPIPPARLFQDPDSYGTGAILGSGYTGVPPTTGTGGWLPPAVSNATDSGDPWVNNLVPYNGSGTTLAAAEYTLNNGFSSLAWSGGTLYASGAAAPLPATGALPPIAFAAYLPYSSLTIGGTLANLTLPATYLGSGGRGSNTDDRQHPYWRSEMMQKAMNLTTVRTHQYAVWITIGFFEIKRQGDIANLAQNNPQLAFDILGPEVGAVTGNNVRFRGFFLVDRLKLTGFDPANIGSFRSAVVYRKIIQ